MGIRIRITADINPTESEEKVVRAIKNLIGNQEKIAIEIVDKDAKKVAIVNGELNLLSYLKQKILIKQIQPLVRIILFRNKRETTSYILLNKQAAYADRIVVCESQYESPLGPIKIEIIGDEEEDLDLAIYWLTEDVERVYVS